MANFIVATLPLTGHVHAALLLVQALVRAGHGVRWYTGKKFRQKVAATGATFAPMNVALDFDDSDLDASFPERKSRNGLAKLKFDLKHIFVDAIPGQMLDLEELLRQAPADALLGDPLLMGVSFVSARTGVPYANLGHTPLGTPSVDTAPFGLCLHPVSGPLGRLRNRILYFLTSRVLFRDVEAHYRAMRIRHGFSPEVPGGFFGSFLLADLFLQSTTPSFEYPRTDLPDHVHFVGPMLPPAPATFNPPAWWAELAGSSRPVVHVTQGTLDTDPANLIIPTMQALAAEDVLVVATTGGRPLSCIPENLIPGNARVAEFVPHAFLLPHVDVMVTNAGYGGAQVALSHGVPLVAAGGAEDKPEVASRIAWSGVGLDLRSGKPRPERIRSAVLDVLARPGFKERALAMKSEIGRYRGEAQAVELLEELVRQHGLKSRR